MLCHDNVNIRMYAVGGRAIANDFWPLDQHHLAVITTNFSILVSATDPDHGLIDSLKAAGCINSQQKEHVVSLHGQTNRSRTLVNFLTRRSIADLRQWIICLENAGQHRAASLLPRAGGRL